jgi:hypothetical protein
MAFLALANHWYGVSCLCVGVSRGDLDGETVTVVDPSPFGEIR